MHGLPPMWRGHHICSASDNLLVDQDACVALAKQPLCIGGRVLGGAPGF